MSCSRKILFWGVGLFLLVFWGIFNPSNKETQAAVTGCSARVSPTSSQPGTNDIRFDFSITNNDPANNIRWFKITRPFSAVTIKVVGLFGWTKTSDADSVTYSDGNVSPEGSVNPYLTVDIGEINDVKNWIITASDDVDGANPVACSGDLSLLVGSGGADLTAPVISDIAISEITSSSVKISWKTNEAATSLVKYDVNADYNTYPFSHSNSDLVSEHIVTVTNSIAANTTYYYKICSSDGANNESCTTEGSFTTAGGSVAVPTPQIAVAPTAGVITTPTPTPTPRPLIDTVKPVVSISTDFSKPYLIAPTIEGKAYDGGDVNVGVVEIEYSLDGGKNWLPVDNLKGAGNKSASFEFTPVGLDDGNYLIKMRAKDSTGNVGLSRSYTMVIDRLPPQVGGSLFTLGPMILKSDSSGYIHSIAGMEIKVTMSAVGGPIIMDLFFDSQKFSLLKNEESGLWSGLIKVDKSGSFQLINKSVDGAKNETERKMSTIVALSPGKIVDEDRKVISKAKIKIYTFEKSRNDYVLWESEPYMQVNPQESDDNGEYRLILPPGKYYLEIEVKGKRKLRSEIFELQTATPINQDFNLEKALFWGNWWAKTVPISLMNKEGENKKNILNGKMIPDFDLSVGENLFSNTSILGRPSVITFISSWEPQTSDQLLELDQFKMENEGVNVVAVVIQESVSKVEIFKKIGEYKIPIMADPDGILVLPLNLESLPTHILLDRKGMMKDIYIGFLNKNNLLTRILN